MLRTVKQESYKLNEDEYIYITLWGFYLLHLGYLQAQKYAWKIKGHATF